MSALLLIWTVSLVLASAAVLVMGTLVILRLISSWRHERHLAARRRLAPLLLEGGEIAPEALRRIPDHVVTDLSLDLIQLVRGAEREAFIANATRLGVPARLARRLRSGSPRDRATALQGIAQFDGPDARAALHRALDDRNRDIRLAAAQALAAKGEPLDPQDLVRRLELGVNQSSRVTISLFQAIAETRPDEIKALVLQPDQNLDVRIAAIEALAATGDYSLVPVIAELALAVEDGSEELPRYLHALGKLEHPSGARAVLAGLSSGSMAARAAAARAAGRIAIPDSIERLTQLLNDREWWVRFRAAEALIAIGEPGVDRLRYAAASGYGPAREAASTMLAERGLA
ncbi:MAG TPA: HEAT repeat domain-containing protein [Sphingomonas sp.]|nr:HEAT repeat domain-containing protein [Sphingomonas sp.]